jgi:hypothetical protein
VSSGRHAREKEVFLAILEAPQESRAELLDTLCSGDVEMRDAVAELLALDAEPDPIDPPSRRFGEGQATNQVTALPTDLLWAGVRRLRIVATLLPITLLAMWVVPVTLAGRLGTELRDPTQSGPPVVAILASLVVVWMTSVSPSPRRALNVGLVYQVVVAYALAGAQYWGTFFGYPPEAIDFDVVGFSTTAVWMLMYSVIVPARPSRALPALLLSATAPSVAYAVTVRAGQAPPLDASRYFYAFVFPQLAAVVFSYIAVRVVYRLGRDVGRARELGSYKLEQLLGEGGMGQVWRASHRLLARPAAVKLIRPDAFGGTPDLTRAAIGRFEREAQTTALLRSRNTVELYDFGLAHDGSLYYVMEFLDGVDLEKMVRRFGPLEPARVVWLARQACRSLSEAHERGLVHGDIKPANLFVCRQADEADVLKVLDFGLVHFVRERGGAPASGACPGTPDFMAPELSRSEAPHADERSDLYALGCTIFWALTRSLVFPAPTVAATLAAHRDAPPPPPSAHCGAVPRSLDTVVLRCLEKEPARRYSSVADLDAALRSLSDVGQWSEGDASRWWAEHDPTAAVRPTTEGAP